MCDLISRGRGSLFSPLGLEQEILSCRNVSYWGVGRSIYAMPTEECTTQCSFGLFKRLNSFRPDFLQLAFSPLSQFLILIWPRDQRPAARLKPAYLELRHGPKRGPNMRHSEAETEVYVNVPNLLLAVHMLAWLLLADLLWLDAQTNIDRPVLV